MNINSLITEKLLEFFTFNQTGYVYYIAIFVLYIWILFLALGIYVYIDLRKRGGNLAFSIIIALFVFLLNIPGFILYLILRPTKTKEEQEWEELERKFISQEIEDYTVCSNCGNVLRSEDMFCAHCGLQHRAKCSCGEILEQDWEFCPSCGVESSFYKPGNIEEEQKSFIHFPSFRKEEKKLYKTNVNNSEVEVKTRVDQGKVMIQSELNNERTGKVSKHVQPKINIHNDIIEKAVKEAPLSIQSREENIEQVESKEKDNKLSIGKKLGAMAISIRDGISNGTAKFISITKIAKTKGGTGINAVKVKLSTLGSIKTVTPSTNPVQNSYVEKENKKLQDNSSKKKKSKSVKRKKHKKKGSRKKK